MIRVSHADGVATIALDRAATRNAVTLAGWHRLADAFASLPADTRVVVLSSATPGLFSAGADLHELARLADHPEDREAFRVAMRRGIDALAAVPIPTIAAIDGPCHGAAVALMLAADLRIAAPAARFAVPPARLGIAYPAEDVVRLSARIGGGQAARLLFTGMTIDAHEALRIGLIDAIEDALGVAGGMAAGIAANDPAALKTLKAMLRDPAAQGHATAFRDSFASAAFRRATARYR